jgi:hypothetical protein
MNFVRAINSTGNPGAGLYAGSNPLVPRVTFRISGAIIR